jgi:hypothetical protein
MDPTSLVSISLQLQEWQQALEVLATGPWRVVNPLIQKIMEQAQRAQQTEASQPAGASQAPIPNGELPSDYFINRLTSGG